MVYWMKKRYKDNEMVFKIQYKIMIVIITIIVLLVLFTYIQINTSIKTNFRRYIENILNKYSEIVSKDVLNILAIKKQNIIAFANKAG